MAGAEGSLHPKLPLWPTIRLAYASYFGHFGDVLRISAIWLLLLAMFDAAMGWMQASWMSHAMASPTPHPNLTEPAEIAILGNISGIALAIAAVSIAVAWHRRLLLDEKPGRSGSNLVTGTFWRYVAVVVVVGVISALPLLVVLSGMWLFGLTPAADDVIAPQTPALIAAAVVAYLAGIVILVRVCLLLPANATGNIALTVTGAWRGSRGNGWRLFWGLVACTLPPSLLAGIVFVGLILLPVPDNVYRLQWAAASAISTCAWLIAWPIGIGFLSHAYRKIVQANAS